MRPAILNRLLYIAGVDADKDAVWLAAGLITDGLDLGPVASGFQQKNVIDMGGFLLHRSYYFPHQFLLAADLCHAHSAQGNCRYGCSGTNDAQTSGNQNAKPFGRFIIPLPPLFLLLKTPSVTFGDSSSLERGALSANAEPMPPSQGGRLHHVEVQTEELLFLKDDPKLAEHMIPTRCHTITTARPHSACAL